jgi:hypothetical protein
MFIWRELITTTKLEKGHKRLKHLQVLNGKPVGGTIVTVQLSA